MMLTLFLLALVLLAGVARGAHNDEELVKSRAQIAADNFLAALGAGNLDALMDNYGHNSVVSFSSGEQYVGKDEIRAFFATLTAPGALLAPETYELEVRTASTIEHVVFLEFSLRTTSTGATYRGATTFVVKDKRIVSHTLAVGAAPF